MDIRLRPEVVRRQLIALGIPAEQHSAEGLRRLVPTELRGSIPEADPELLRELVLHWAASGLLRVPTSPASLAIRQTARGTHSCQVYRDAEDLIEIAVPWLRAAVEDDSFGLWIVPESIGTETALGALAAAIPDFPSRLARRQFEVVSATRWYFGSGSRPMEEAELGAAWGGKIEQAKRDGYGGVRAVGDMSWIAGREDVERFLAYEERCNELAAALPLAGLCTYHVDSLPEHGLRRVAESHQRAFLKADGVWHRMEGPGPSAAALEALRDRVPVSGGVRFAAPTLSGRPFPANRHACGFFRDQDDQYRTLIPFIQEGFSRGEKAVHVVKREDQDAHLRRLEGAGIEVEAALSRGQLELLDWESTYLRGGRFDLAAMPGLIEDLIARSREEGYPLMRYVGNMEWSLEDRPGVGDVLEYESKLHPLLLKYPDPVICCYQIGRYSPEFVLEMMSVHQVAIVCGILNENSYFIPPERYLASRRGRFGPPVS